MTKQIKDPRKLTTDDDQSALRLPHSKSIEIVRALLQFEGRKDLSDGVLTLPALRPFVYAYLFTETLQRLAEELRNLRGKYDAGRRPDGYDASELEPETFAGAVLESLASWLDCAAEDGTWSDDTFSGLGANLTRELMEGCTTAELQLIKDTPALHWSTEAFATREREERVRLVTEALKVTPPELLPLKRQSIERAVQAFKVTSGGEEIEPRDPATLSPKTRQRIERVRETLATKPSAVPAGRAGHCEATVNNLWEIEYRRVRVGMMREQSGAIETSLARVTASSEAEARALFAKGFAGELVGIDAVRRLTESYDHFADVVAAMQNAEEMGGPEDEDYIELMQKIAEEAIRRRDVCNANLIAKKGAH